MSLSLNQDIISNIQSVSYDCLKQLATSEGIFASSKEEAYGCVFGRDTAITVLKLLNVYQKNGDLHLLEMSKNALLSLVALQGRETNLESGEEPGKFIHEFRKDNYERLIARERPWYVYPDKMLRNFDSIDSTPLTLIAIKRYVDLSKDSSFLLKALPAVEAGLEWIVTYADRDGDSLVEYELPHLRVHGGLVVQSWTDSFESLVSEDGKFPKYPIAPVEVQGVTWLALKIWGNFFAESNPPLARRYNEFSNRLKEKFISEFIIRDGDYYFAAQALDGDKNKIRTITANPLICLWATFANETKLECIVPEEYISGFVARAMREDMFDPSAGIRTMSVLSPTYNPRANSYHNGSFWPMLNGLIHEGFMKWGFNNEADRLLHAALLPIHHFNTPIELYLRDENDGYLEYESNLGKKGCRFQAWSAAAALDFTFAYPNK